MPGVTTEGRTGMGLGGSVMCGCFKQGRVKESPVPLEWLHIDEEGDLNLRPEYDSDEAFFKVSDWKQTACPHPDFSQVNEHVANWSGYWAFQQALARVGWDNYPTMQCDLPEANGGLTLSSAAALALKELAHFRSLGQVGQDTFLVETATGEVLHRHIAASDGVFLYGAGEKPRAGIGPSQFFVEDPATGACLFRSVCFRQTRVAAPPGEDLVDLEDLNGGGSYRGPVTVRRYDQGRCEFVLPAELHVETRVVKPADFDHILSPLESLFRASEETGNPVRWS
jgi:hypothetical protein